MKPTDVLKEEHEGIKVGLKVLEKMAEGTEKGLELKVVDVEKILEFIRGFADKCHHAKEEKLLFPALEKAGIPKNGGPIGVMLSDHEEGRGYVAGMQNALESIKAGRREGEGAFARYARSYINLLRGHIEKENMILFPLSDEALSKGEQEELVGAFEVAEKEEIGVGKHEQFHRTLDELKFSYSV